jgi:hypothetical protein
MTMLTEYLSMTEHAPRGVRFATKAPRDLPSTDEDVEPQALYRREPDAPAEVLQL